MSPAPQGRSGAASRSIKLGAADPRARRNAQIGISDDDVGAGLKMENGQVMLGAFDGIPALPATADLAAVIARLNLITKRGQGG
jgi:hypothetical protein